MRRRSPRRCGLRSGRGRPVAFLLLLFGDEPVPDDAAEVEEAKHAGEEHRGGDAGGRVAQVDAVERQEVGVDVVEIVKDPANLSQPFLEPDFGISNAPMATLWITLNRSMRLSVVS